MSASPLRVLAGTGWEDKMLKGGVRTGLNTHMGCLPHPASAVTIKMFGLWSKPQPRCRNIICSQFLSISVMSQRCFLHFVSFTHYYYSYCYDRRVDGTYRVTREVMERISKEWCSTGNGSKEGRKISVWKGTEVRDAVAYSSERGRKYLKKSTALLNATENLRIMNTEKGI